MSVETTRTCDVCQTSDGVDYWYRLTSRGMMDWDQIDLDVCSIACPRKYEGHEVEGVKLIDLFPDGMLATVDENHNVISVEPFTFPR